MSSERYAPATLRDLIAVHAIVRVGRLNRFTLVRVLRRAIVRSLTRERNEVLVSTPYGFNIQVPSGDLRLMESTLQGVLFETSVGSALQRVLRPGDVLLDGGAHVGLYTILGALSVGSLGKVIAFEPHPTNIESLKRNVELNRLGLGVVIEQMALTSQCGTANFHWSPSLTTHGRLLGDPASDSNVTPVRTVAFDEYLLDKGGQVDVIKLDLEGGEFQALQGMSRTVSRARCLILEVNDPRLREQELEPQWFVNWAMRLGGFERSVVLPIEGDSAASMDVLPLELTKFGFTNVMFSR